MRDIVVHCPGFRNWHASVRYAAQLAASTRATLTGLYVTARDGSAPGPPLLAEEVTAYAQEELHQAILAGRRFAEWAGQLGAREARWQVAIGPLADALVLAGNWTDVLVLQGLAPSSSAGERLFCEVLLSGTACIAVPDANVAPGRVVHAVVAWNDSAASNRALHGALPLLRGAESVTLLQASSAKSNALSHLRAHGVVVTTVGTIAAADESASEQLLAYAADQRADLLVMGASGRRRLGDRCLGPTTSAVLSQSRVPVFLKH
ncbi:universal stress protein [Rhodanobacter umsongensis]|uniref:Universal stress protein n=1 Tax=Rhodanobacter umsongensis TaxID=633153 RepID=A0ABW0JHU9_9GAMM